MASITATQARASLLLRKKDLSDVSNDVFLQWCDFLNKFIYRKLTNTDPERYASTQNYTVTSSPQTSALPADFENIEPLGCGFFQQSPLGVNTVWTLGRTGFGSSNQGYYITGTNVVFTGINNSTVYVLRYIPTISTMDEVTDTFVVDDFYLEYLVNALDVQYNIWDEDSGAEMLSDQRFVRSMDELLGSIRKEPNAFGIPDYSSSF